MKKRFAINERRIAVFILIAIVAVTVFSFIVMALWNNVLAVVLHINTITFWQALGILVLSKILFSGFRGGSSWRGHHDKRKELFYKWENMTPEEREKFKQEWQGRCRQWRRPVEDHEERES